MGQPFDRFDDGRWAGLVLSRDIECGAMSDGGEQDGSADRQGRGASRRQQLGGNMALIVEHDHEGVVASTLHQNIGADRTVDVYASAAGALDCRGDDFGIFAAKHAMLSGVWVESGNGDARYGDAETAQGRGGYLDGMRDALERDQLDGAPKADVQGDVHDAFVVDRNLVLNAALTSKIEDRTSVAHESHVTIA